MTKIDEAIAKITKECKDNKHLIPFEEYLTSICKTDKIADKILAEDRSLQGCFEKMKFIAQGRAVNQAAYIPPEEGFEIIRKYYDIELNSKPETIDISDFL